MPKKSVAVGAAGAAESTPAAAGSKGSAPAVADSKSKAGVTAVVPRPRGRPKKWHAEDWIDTICEQLEQGLSLAEICRRLGPEAPTKITVLDWVDANEAGFSDRYVRSRQLGYQLLADEITKLSAETHAYTLVPEVDENGRQLYDENGVPRGRQVLVPLSPEVMASKRLQIDTRKWMLSKVLPKIYGDRVVQEHVGVGGGPVAMAAVDMRNLSDAELETMRRLMAKAAGASE